MVNRKLTAFFIVCSVAAINPLAAQKRSKLAGGSTVAKPAIKFLDAIQVQAVDGAPAAISTASEVTQPAPIDVAQLEKETGNTVVESATRLQLKYSILLDLEVEQLLDTTLLSAVDEWYGTRYVLGGSTKEGIDCSAFIQAVYTKLFQNAIPRTAKEQYHATRPLSRTELKEGDLVFFNTRGSSISHVGIYLQNNKFIHASTSGGVMVSSMDEEYWQRRYTAAGRFEQQAPPTGLTMKP